MLIDRLHGDSPPLDQSTVLDEDENTDVSRAPSRRPAYYWQEYPLTRKSHLHHEREPFVPCNHAGACSEKNACVCANQLVFCEKTCACPSTCPQKFRGCRCAAKGKICRDNDRCECWLLNRECDPDLCLPCKAHEVLDPANRHKENITAGRCANVAIQRGIPKRTLLGVSKIMANAKKDGLGLYMGEYCRKNEFIGEYVGEIITEAEAVDRGFLYDNRNMSYLFTLNSGMLRATWQRSRFRLMSS